MTGQTLVRRSIKNMLRLVCLRLSICVGGAPYAAETATELVPYALERIGGRSDPLKFLPNPTRLFRIRACTKTVSTPLVAGALARGPLHLIAPAG